MVSIGYVLSSEEQAPNDLVTQARRGEPAGFGFGRISFIEFGERELLPRFDLEPARLAS